ncbi:sensor histidine kinase [Ethanoligenens harbinense]|nr:two-component sensor histidine kinase [Ethanoligenens harbinense YUAN-3]AYF39359.1 two-component sensor histidine kinase [Ethanoligenens harbinense]AYF42184.1 two-component sensor histidine kinase [Ethanoligenens harbinense]QCN92939.1 sensor histidine kinase [Ethanoligenens harbinense]
MPSSAERISNKGRVNRLTIVIGVLCILLAGAGIYIALLQWQLRHINRQLQKRLSEHTRQMVSLELFDRRLNALAANINNCLQAEETLRLQGAREEKQFREMIANLSHDLRTPLTAVKGYQQLLSKSGLTPQQQEKVRVAQKHAEQLGQLIEHFFEYACLLYTEVRPQPERINLGNLAAECLADSVSVFEENGLAVQFDTEPAVFALADREMVVRILQNLIRNCAQHAGGVVEVHIRQDRCAMLSFRNRIKEGAEPDAARLFERFYTADPARARSGGLGLAIVKLLAERNGGQAGTSIRNGALEIEVTLPNANT